ncbi:MAG TPA: homocitrate synthase [Cyanobacteria bacterium UBA12227]|nr:homocitrate synthase [Cyanobacteria bacterium UBA12227]HAX89654.1 homocitrate synthase [Cyanobacteria bacterium UBA11370]HBY79919.1 homocitrate synthase [Cyanobacteria bacterium UBA11148]
MALNQFAIVESTLREGEQFYTANFSSNDKVQIATELDNFGVEYIELTSPCASPQSYRDCQQLTQLGLRTKVLTHIRCHLEDAKVALDTGVNGINMFMGTSSLLRQFGHGKSINELIDLVAEVATFIHYQSPQTELRFSPEDAFRSSLSDLLRVYLAIDQLGLINRFGIADTVGVATPNQVFNLVQTLRQCTDKEIEFHGHNDTGCAIANSYAALEAGATHIDTTVLGIGERNGITPLAGLIARLYTIDPEQLARKYQLHQLLPLHQLITDKIGIKIPFNHYIIGEAAFSHKAGIHTKAILNNPKTYEAIDPSDFGLTRSFLINHKLTGKHAIANRASQLGLQLDTLQIQTITQQIKALADQQDLTVEEVDELLYSTFNVQHNRNPEEEFKSVSIQPSAISYQQVAG